MQRRLIIQTLAHCADTIDKMALDLEEHGLGENDTTILMDVSRNLTNTISYIRLGEEHKLKTVGLLALGIVIGLILSPMIESIFRIFS